MYCAIEVLLKYLNQVSTERLGALTNATCLNHRLRLTYYKQMHPRKRRISVKPFHPLLGLSRKPTRESTPNLTAPPPKQSSLMNLHSVFLRERKHTPFENPVVQHCAGGGLVPGVFFEPGDYLRVQWDVKILQELNNGD